MEKLELDQRIRTKNLELSKALQTIDRLKTITVELEERIKELEAFAVRSSRNGR
tara:strand:+ start:156 stop:317 length:162 start_codon:yes stop_codon:yes gene_type:complete